MSGNGESGRGRRSSTVVERWRGSSSAAATAEAAEKAEQALQARSLRGFAEPLDAAAFARRRRFLAAEASAAARAAVGAEFSTVGSSSAAASSLAAALAAAAADMAEREPGLPVDFEALDRNAFEEAADAVRQREATVLLVKRDDVGDLQLRGLLQV